MRHFRQNSDTGAGEGYRTECLRALFYARRLGWPARAADHRQACYDDGTWEELLIEDFSDCGWLYWCPELSVDRWRRERREVEARFSLFRSFAEPPFFGFRGVVARAGSAYNVTVAADMDMYPTLQPWVFVTPASRARMPMESYELMWPGVLTRPLLRM